MKRVVKGFSSEVSADDDHVLLGHLLLFRKGCGIETMHKTINGKQSMSLTAMGVTGHVNGHGLICLLAKNKTMYGLLTSSIGVHHFMKRW